MNRINYIFILSLLSLLLGACDKPYKPSDGPSDRMAYINEFLGSDATSFTVDKLGGKGTITPRISGLVDQNTTLTVEVAPEVLEAYNAKNKTSFKLLPDANFNFEVKEGHGSVSDNGNKATITVSSAKVDEALTINVISMMEGGVKPPVIDENTTPEEAEQLKQIKELPTFYNYAIPVRLTSTTTGSVQENASTGVIFLNRKFEANAYYAQSGALTMAYKTTDPAFNEDPDFSAWSYQVFIKIGPSARFSNFGLVYPNTRTSSNSPLYVCFYSDESPTFFPPEGKFGFNQKEFTEGFKFERNKWYNFAATFGPNEDGVNVLKFYVNGKLAYSQPTSLKNMGWQKAIIGNGGFTGWVRDWRLWNKELTPGEIKETMWSVDPKSEGLMMYLPLDKDFKSIIPGHEDDWILVGAGNGYHFRDKYTFPMEM